MVHDVPSRMEEPAETDEAVGVESLEGAIGDDSREGKLPEAQPAIKIGSASARNHDGVEVPALWFLERRCRDDEESGNDDRRDDIDQVHLHGGMVPFWNDRLRCRAVPQRVLPQSLPRSL